MSQPIQGPDGNIYQFPDGTDKAAAIGYFKKKGVGAAPDKPDMQTTLANARKQNATPLPKQYQEEGTFDKVARGAVLGLASGVGLPETQKRSDFSILPGLYQEVRHPINSASLMYHSIKDPMSEHWRQAQDAAGRIGATGEGFKGAAIDATQALTHVLAGSVPMIGPAAYGIGGELAGGFHEGSPEQIAHGTGSALGMLATLGLGGKKGGSLLDATTDAVKNAKPIEFMGEGAKAHGEAIAAKAYGLEEKSIAAKRAFEATNKINRLKTAVDTKAAEAKAAKGEVEGLAADETAKGTKFTVNQNLIEWLAFIRKRNTLIRDKIAQGQLDPEAKVSGVWEHNQPGAMNPNDMLALRRDLDSVINYEKVGRQGKSGDYTPVEEVAYKIRKELDSALDTRIGKKWTAANEKAAASYQVRDNIATRYKNERGKLVTNILPHTLEDILYTGVFSLPVIALLREHGFVGLGSYVSGAVAGGFGRLAWNSLPNQIARMLFCKLLVRDLASLDEGVSGGRTFGGNLPPAPEAGPGGGLNSAPRPARPMPSASPRLNSENIPDAEFEDITRNAFEETVRQLPAAAREKAVKMLGDGKPKATQAESSSTPKAESPKAEKK